MRSGKPANAVPVYSMSWGKRAARDLFVNKDLYLLVIPVLAYYIIFHYAPMYGAQIAFRDYRPTIGIWESTWVGFDHFERLFASPFFWRIIRNTLTISVATLIFGFPAPILLAILLNELRSRMFSRVVQTISYLPHFISTVVIAGMIVQFVGPRGIITQMLNTLGLIDLVPMLNFPNYFVPIYVTQSIWQTMGFGSIIYLAALQGIDQELYEAAKIDGAGRFKQVLYITLPGIAPTIIILLILRMGQLLSVGHEMILLLYNPLTYETADVISTFVYRAGLLDFQWSFSTAVNLFNSVINFSLVLTANWLSRKFSETSLF